MKSFDFLDLLGDVPEDLVASCFAAPAVPERQIPRPWLRTGLAAGTAAAACIAAVAGIGCLLQDDGLTQQSSNLEAMMQEVVTEPVQTAAEPAQTAPAVTAPPEEALAVPAQTETAPAVTDPAAEPTPMETEPTATEATPAQTEPTKTQPPADSAPEQHAEPEPEQLVFELGDVDMDGKITFVDAALVMVDVNLAQYGMLDQSLITEEQRVLGNVNGLEDGELLKNDNLSKETVLTPTDNNYTSFALSNEDYWAIYYTALYRNWYDIEFSPADYFRYCEEHPDYLNTDSAKMGDYRNDLEIIRPGLIDALFLHVKMCMALTGHKPLDSQIAMDDNGKLMIGDLYNEEDFWNMAEELLTYFDDAVESKGA